MRTVGSLLAALAAAATFAASSVGQQYAAGSEPSSESLKPSLLVHLARRKEFVLGMVGLIAACALQAVALALSTVALVEPIITTELVFAVPLAIRVRGQRPTRRELLGAAGVSAGAALFLFGASPRSGAHPAAAWSWALTLGVAGAAIGALAVAGRRARARRRAGLLGVAAGLANGLIALITKGLLLEVQHGLLSVLESWQPYLLLVVGAGSFLLGQSAFQAAPLADSLPYIDVLEPVTAVALSPLLLAEAIRASGAALGLELSGAALAVAGVFTLARSPVVLAVYERQRQEQRRRSAEPSACST